MALDAQKLIECIKNTKIYVSTVKPYKDSNRKETAWKQVANELGLCLEDVQGGLSGLPGTHFCLTYFVCLQSNANTDSLGSGSHHKHKHVVHSTAQYCAQCECRLTHEYIDMIF